MIQRRQLAVDDVKIGPAHTAAGDLDQTCPGPGAGSARIDGCNGCPGRSAAMANIPVPSLWRINPLPLVPICMVRPRRCLQSNRGECPADRTGGKDDTDGSKVERTLSIVMSALVLLWRQRARGGSRRPAHAAHDVLDTYFDMKVTIRTGAGERR